MVSEHRRLGLLLTGGGARTAYQVGVLLAVAGWLPRGSPLPFPVLCGTSAGAINAAVLASHARDFRQGAARLASVWAHFSTGQVVRADRRTLTRASLRWLLALVFGSRGQHNPRALLDVAPLRTLLERRLDLGAIANAIAEGQITAFGVTALSYGHGRSVTFFQGHPEIKSWMRARHQGVATAVGLDHLLASAAIPFLFPAICVDGSWFGDGSMRQTAPVSPAIHLGAERILIVDIRQTQPASHDSGYPSLARLGGHVLNSIFLDNLEPDLERLTRVNEAMEHLAPSFQARMGLRAIDTCVVTPSADLSALAFTHRKSLPRALRRVLGRLGALSEGGADLMSYLLFERAYCRELMTLGREDARSRKDELLAFIREPARSAALAGQPGR